MQIETDDNLFCHFSDRLVVGVIVSRRMRACDMAEKIIIKKDSVLESVKGWISCVYRKYCCQSV